MQKSRLIELLRTFSTKEKRTFVKFLASPVHNQREDVQLLFAFLEPLIPDFPPKKVNKTEAFTHCYPGKKYNEKQINYTMSFLYQLAKDYLVWQAFEQEKVKKQLLLSRVMRRKRLDRHFESEIKVAERLLEEQSLRDSEYHYLRFACLAEKNDFKAGKVRKVSEQEPLMEAALTHFFMAQQLILACSSLTQGLVKQHNVSSPFLEKVLQLAPQAGKSIPAISLYHAVYKLFTVEHPEDYFQQLRKEIRLYAHCFSPNELRGIYILTINYCIRQFNQGKRIFLEEAFALYQEGLDYRLFFDNQTLSKFTYGNIVMCGVILNEFEWVKQFIYDYKSFLPKDDRDSFFNYNLAKLNYYKGDYTKAMQLLHAADLQDVFHNLDARRMLCKMYYELQEFDALDYQLIALRTYVYRQRGLSYHRSLNLNFISLIRKLIQQDVSDPKVKIKLRKEMEGKEYLAERNWLLEQL